MRQIWRHYVVIGALLVAVGGVVYRYTGWLDSIMRGVQQVADDGGWKVAALLVASVILVPVFVALIRRGSRAAKFTAALLAIVLLILGVGAVDLSGPEKGRTFMADRAVLSAVFTSLLLLVAGLLTYDAKTEGDRRKRAARVCWLAFDEVMKDWREGVIAYADTFTPDGELWGWTRPKERHPGPGLPEWRLGQAAEAAGPHLVRSVERVSRWLPVLAGLDDDEANEVVVVLAEYRRLVEEVTPEFAGRFGFDLLPAAGALLEQVRHLSSSGGRAPLYPDVLHAWSPSLAGANSLLDECVRRLAAPPHEPGLRGWWSRQHHRRNLGEFVEKRGSLLEGGWVAHLIEADLCNTPSSLSRKTSGSALERISMWETTAIGWRTGGEPRDRRTRTRVLAARALARRHVLKSYAEMVDQIKTAEGFTMAAPTSTKLPSDSSV